MLLQFDLYVLLYPAVSFPFSAWHNWGKKGFLCFQCFCSVRWTISSMCSSNDCTSVLAPFQYIIPNCLWLRGHGPVCSPTETVYFFSFSLIIRLHFYFFSDLSESELLQQTELYRLDFWPTWQETCLRWGARKWSHNLEIIRCPFLWC